MKPKIKDYGLRKFLYQRIEIDFGRIRALVLCIIMLFQDGFGLIDFEHRNSAKERKSMFRLKHHLKIASDASGSEVDHRATDAANNVEVLNVSADAIESVRPCRETLGPVGNQQTQVVPGYMTVRTHGGEELIVSEVTATALLQVIGVQNLPSRRT